MISRIVDIQKKSSQYVANLSANIVRVIESNQGKTIDLNRSQLLGSKDAENRPLIHKKTGSSYLSKAYSRRTGKRKPNLFESGVFQDKMFLTMPSKDEYFISSKDYKTGFLAGNYGSIFGISQPNQPKAQKENDKLVINDYLNSVFK